MSSDSIYKGAVLIFLSASIVAMVAIGTVVKDGILENTEAVKKNTAVLEEIAKLVHPKNPQFNIMHGYYYNPSDPDAEKQPFRTIRITREGLVLTKCE